MARSQLVDDGLWELVKPLLPDHIPQRIGRPRVSDRTALAAIVFVMRTGVPLAVALTGGNRNDITQLLPLVDGIMPVAGKVGRPRQRPDRIIADRGYDHDSYRRELWRRGVKPSIARR
jgi:transposase